MEARCRLNPVEIFVRHDAGLDTFGYFQNRSDPRRGRFTRARTSQTGENPAGSLGTRNGVSGRGSERLGSGDGTSPPRASVWQSEGCAAGGSKSNNRSPPAVVRVELHPEADAEFTAQAEYYKDRQSGLGQRF